MSKNTYQNLFFCLFFFTKKVDRFLWEIMNLSQFRKSISIDTDSRISIQISWAPESFWKRRAICLIWWFSWRSLQSQLSRIWRASRKKLCLFWLKLIKLLIRQRRSACSITASLQLITDTEASPAQRRLQEAYFLGDSWPRLINFVARQLYGWVWIYLSK